MNYSNSLKRRVNLQMELNSRLLRCLLFEQSSGSKSKYYIILRYFNFAEFADAQMNIRDIKSDLVTTRVPFCDYQTYVLHLLFPNQDIKSNPLLHDSEVIYFPLFFGLH